MLKSKITDYNFPEDLKTMSLDEMELLSYALRDYLVDTISKTGGHIASNLGAVELTMALHKVFESPKDKIIWDVGHQAYVHKILTGRAEALPTIRQMNGISGFPKKKESIHDVHDSGHSSSSLSFAAGLAAARDLAGENHDIIAVIGDGALTGGLAYEALNNIGDSRTKMIVILNDNGMSISANTGSVSKHLGRLRASKKYLNLKKSVRKRISNIPNVGNAVLNGMIHFRNTIKYSVIDEGVLFEELGFKYYGPIEGHSLDELIETLDAVRHAEGPVLIHVITSKGKGYSIAEEHPDKFHGIGPFNPETGEVIAEKKGLSYSEVYGDELVKLAGNNPKITAVCAAMIDGTGLNKFKEKYPNRIFDVGIAEGHAVTFAAGLCKAGYRPFVSIYSTFLQRAFDEILEDVCLQKLPVIFGIDRAGAVGADGETHHGVFDLSYLSMMPGMTVLAPSSGDELCKMMNYAVTLDGPCAVRYPRGTAETGNAHLPEIEYGVSRIIKEGKDVELWAVGNMVSTALEISDRLAEKNIEAGVIDARFIKPLDREGLENSALRTGCIVTLEDNVLTGGFGEQAGELLKEKNENVLFRSFGWPDEFIEHGTVDQLRRKHGLDAETLTERISDFIEGKA